MNYLVVHDKRGRIGITIEPAGKTYDYPIKVWAIANGKQVEFAHMRMHKLLASYHYGGSYQTFAMYALSFEELTAIVEAHMGPSDEDRYKALLEEEAAAQTMDRQMGSVKAHVATFFAIQTGSFIVKFMWYASKFVLFCMVFPFVIHWFNKKGGSGRH